MTCSEILALIIAGVAALAVLFQTIFAAQVRNYTKNLKEIGLRQALLNRVEFKISLLYRNVGILEKQKGLPDGELKENTIQTVMAHNERLVTEIKELEEEEAKLPKITENYRK